MRVFSSEPLYLLKNRLKQSLFAEQLDDLDYQECWTSEEDDGTLANEAYESQETTH